MQTFEISKTKCHIFLKTVEKDLLIDPKMYRKFHFTSNPGDSRKNTATLLMYTMLSYQY